MALSAADAQLLAHVSHTVQTKCLSCVDTLCVHYRQVQGMSPPT